MAPLGLCAEQGLVGFRYQPLDGEVRLALRRGDANCELYFAAGQCKDAKLGELEGDPAVFQAVLWTDGEFEIDFGSSSDRVTTTRSTTGLLMEAMRLIDEASSDRVER